MKLIAAALATVMLAVGVPATPTTADDAETHHLFFDDVWQTPDIYEDDNQFFKEWHPTVAFEEAFLPEPDPIKVLSKITVEFDEFLDANMGAGNITPNTHDYLLDSIRSSLSLRFVDSEARPTLTNTDYPSLTVTVDPNQIENSERFQYTRSGTIEITDPYELWRIQEHAAEGLVPVRLRLYTVHHFETTAQIWYYIFRQMSDVNINVTYHYY